MMLTVLRTYEANICSGSCELGTPAEHPHGSLTQVEPSIDFDNFQGWYHIKIRAYYGHVRTCKSLSTLSIILLLQMAGLHSTAGPCCSPRKMAPINMLYLDQVLQCW